MKLIQNTIAILLVLMTSIQATALGVPNGIYVSGGPADIQFQLIDPLGNKTGYEPSIKGTIENIPNTMYTRQQLTTISDKPWGDPYYKLEPIHNSASYFLIIGKYQLKIYGTNIAKQFSFDISIPCYEDSTDLIYPATKKIIYPNAVWTYEFNIPATHTNNEQIMLTKVSTSVDLIKDMTTAGQLGYIGNKQFASEIIKKAEAIGLKSDQQKEYTELLNEITEKYNKPTSDEFIKQEAYTVLREDLEYIIGHIQ